MPMPDTPGLRHVEHVMGTVFPFDIRDQPTPAIRTASAEAVTAPHFLHGAGARHTCVNGGGDLQLRGQACADRAWRVGRALTLTDAYATAVFAQGIAAQGRSERLDRHEAPAVLPGGRER
ncbi:hypothetical protein SCAB_10821 [Streptomyces scabiei 87.22]|uniref:Uncharacterized protein n=2 Tax=Streptomyces TaxID=1883 RepID=C9Z3J5_STRSW|nr:hypothetical protein SCAB_10821 [Streptomyces scabiei 87.22]